MADIERAELLRTWVAALRSGKYTQGMGRWSDGGAFCVFGVLFEVAGSRGNDVLDLVEPEVAYRAELIRKNDKGASFREIADEIEARNGGVFGEKVERGEGVEDAYLGADASALELVEA